MKPRTWGVVGRISLIATLAVAVGFVPIATSAESAEAATAPPAGLCVADIVHHEEQVKYNKVEKGHAETTHPEKTYKHTGKAWTSEHKDTGLTANNTALNATILDWYAAIGAPFNPDTGKYTLPDALIKAAGVNVFNVAQTGSVDLAYYGFPGHAVVPYVITSTDLSLVEPPNTDLYVTIQSITLYYTGHANGTDTASTDPDDAIYVDAAHAPGSPWVSFGTTKIVGNNDAVPDKTVWRLPGGGQSDTNTSANWHNVSEVVDASWTKVPGETIDAYDETIYGPCPTNEQCVTYSSLKVMSLSQLDLSQERSQGTSKLVKNAMHTVTFDDADNNQPGGKDQRKTAAYLNVTDFLLSKTGALAITYTGTGLGVGGQMLFDLDGDPSNNTLFLAGEYGDSIGVFEPKDYGQNIWLAAIQPGLDVSGPNVPHVGGGGGSINGTADDYLKAWPNAKVLALGYSQGSGPAGDNLLTLIQAGCVQVTFDIPDNTDYETRTDPVEGPPDCVAHTVTTTITTYERKKVWDENSQTYVWGPWTVKSVTTSTRTTSGAECPTTVTPVGPKVVDAGCKDGKAVSATYTIPTTTGVNYYVNGKLTLAGTYPVQSGETVKITAQPVDNTFKLDDPAWSWTKMFPVIICVAGGTLAATGDELLRGGVLTAFGLIMLPLLVKLGRRYVYMFRRTTGLHSA